MRDEPDLAGSFSNILSRVHQETAPVPQPRDAVYLAPIAVPYLADLPVSDGYRQKLLAPLPGVRRERDRFAIGRPRRSLAGELTREFTREERTLGLAVQVGDDQACGLPGITMLLKKSN